MAITTETSPLSAVESAEVAQGLLGHIRRGTGVERLWLSVGVCQILDEPDIADNKEAALVDREGPRRNSLEDDIQKHGQPKRTMVAGVNRNSPTIRERELRLSGPVNQNHSWSCQYILFSVREPVNLVRRRYNTTSL